MGLTNVKGDGECSPGGLAILPKSSLRQKLAMRVGEWNCGRLYVVRLCCPESLICRVTEKLWTSPLVRKECTWSASVWDCNAYWVSTPQQKIELGFLILINVRKQLSWGTVNFFCVLNVVDKSAVWRAAQWPPRERVDTIVDEALRLMRFEIDQSMNFFRELYGCGEIICWEGCWVPQWQERRIRNLSFNSCFYIVLSAVLSVCDAEDVSSYHRRELISDCMLKSGADFGPPMVISKPQKCNDWNCEWHHLLSLGKTIHCGREMFQRKAELKNWGMAL